MRRRSEACLEFSSPPSIPPTQLEHCIMDAACCVNLVKPVMSLCSSGFCICASLLLHYYMYVYIVSDISIISISDSLTTSGSYIAAGYTCKRCQPFRFHLS